MAPHVQVELTNEEVPKPVLKRKYTHELQRKPLPRLDRAAISNPRFEDLFHLASYRILDIVAKSKNDPPPRLFPHAEHIRHSFFSRSVWDEHGDMETEFGRISFMLTRYPERGVPVGCSGIIRGLLSRPNPLQRWFSYVERLTKEAQIAEDEALKAMHPEYPGMPESTWTKDCFVRTPVSYPTDSQASLDLWGAATKNMASDLMTGNISNIEAFLHIHSFIRDPIGGLKAPLLRQSVIFVELWTSVRTTCFEQYQKQLSHEKLQCIVAQLAMESSFLAIPKLQKITHMHFSHHQQYCYVYATIDHLPRAEFSIPGRVQDLLQDTVLKTFRSGECVIAPITIAYTASSRSDNKPFKVIIDGNNRVTALLLLRFLATQFSPEMIDIRALDEYCTAAGLGFKWLMDLRAVLTTLMDRSSFDGFVRRYWDTICRFSKVSRVPALLVQEPSFFTLCLKRGTNERPVLLQPIHQTIFNQDRFCIAFAAKGGQAHGRSLGHAVLPVKFEEV